MPQHTKPNNGLRGSLHALGQGLVAGAVATVPMTLAMLAIRRALPWGERYEVPPEEIVEDLCSYAGIEHELSQEQLDAASAVAHFGYGSAMGALYALTSETLRLTPVHGGISFGLGVWAGSYLGWLPAFGIRASATNEPAGRNAMMLAAHVIWGGTTGVLYHAMRRRSQQHASQSETLQQQQASRGDNRARQGGTEPLREEAAS